MKQETYLTYFADVVKDQNELVETVDIYSDMETAFKEAQNIAVQKIGRVVLVFRQIQAFSAEVVVRPVKQPEAPAKPRKARSDKGIKKVLQHATPDPIKSDSKDPAATDPDKPLFDYDPKTIKKK